MLFKIRFLKFIDSLLGRLLVFFMPAPRSLPISRLSSILLIRPGGIGDALLLSHAIASLHKRFPDAVIDVLAEKRNAQVFAMMPGVRTICAYDDLAGFVTILRRHYAVVIDTEQWYRLSAVVCRLVRSPMKIGFSTNRRRRLFTHPVSYSQALHETEIFLRLLEPLGGAAETMPDSGTLIVPDAARGKAAAMLPELGLKSMLAIFPSASIPEKRWDFRKYRNLVEWCENNNVHVVILGGKQDRALGEQIACGRQALNLAGLTSLAETAAILEKSALVISGDSGVLHLASCLGRPTISLFGPSNATKWAPPGPGNIILNRNLPCSPCTLFGNMPKCPIGVLCLQDINVEEVTAAVMSLLRRKTEGMNN